MGRDREIDMARDDIKRLFRKVTDLQMGFDEIKAECAKLFDRLSPPSVPRPGPNPNHPFPKGR